MTHGQNPGFIFHLNVLFLKKGCQTFPLHTVMCFISHDSVHQQIDISRVKSLSFTALLVSLAQLSLFLITGLQKYWRLSTCIYPPAYTLSDHLHLKYIGTLSIHSHPKVLASYLSICVSKQQVWHSLWQLTLKNIGTLSIHLHPKDLAPFEITCLQNVFTPYLCTCAQKSIGTLSDHVQYNNVLVPRLSACIQKFWHPVSSLVDVLCHG